MQLKIAISTALISASSIGGTYPVAPDQLVALLARTRESAPCMQPIAYRIGAVDPDFPVTRGQFIASLTDAAALWDKAAGSVLFVQDQRDGIVTIGLVGSSPIAPEHELVYPAPEHDAVYRADMPNGRTIELHVFPGRAGLTRLLARELGYALGLSATSTPDAVLNPHARSDTPLLSPADIDAVSELCRTSHPALQAVAE